MCLWCAKSQIRLWPNFQIWGKEISTSDSLATMSMNHRTEYRINADFPSVGYFLRVLAQMLLLSWRYSSTFAVWGAQNTASSTTMESFTALTHMFPQKRNGREHIEDNFWETQVVMTVIKTWPRGNKGLNSWKALPVVCSVSVSSTQAKSRLSELHWFTSSQQLCWWEHVWSYWRHCWLWSL